MPLYRDEAIVLRTHKLAEADRIITLLTRRHGVVRAVGRGVRRTSSKFGSRLEPFTHVDLQLAEGRKGLDTITQAVTLEPYGARITADYDCYTNASVMLETAERLVAEEREPSVQQYLLLVGALRAMTDGTRGSGDVRDSFLLRSLAVAGYAPSFTACARCGVVGVHRAFHPAHGGMLCADCKIPGSASPADDTVVHLGALLAGEWDVVAGADDRTRREAATLVSAYLSWHLERALRSMPLVPR
ncbi:DNA repair protein RecO [Marmoricola endophyticus]|uniref:DNA repair protein RecO n=1 Tax=Marmoricola endophyticus TaxID=2040280 RepID=A0A917B9I5_9ACTN|nr:DNA repair protein RecO [Marmoricola endophyticus]GGF32005.1 DNA repair protein RecO [Marmoricola endophyticus]